MKILLLSVHPPQGGGSANSSQELACGLRTLGHDVLHLSPYKDDAGLAEYAGLRWFPADFPSGLTIQPDVQLQMDQQVQAIYREQGPFDCVVLGRESFLWQLPALRQVHAGPIALICRGAYINLLAGHHPIDPELRSNLYSLYRNCDVVVCIARHLERSVHRAIGLTNTVFLPNPIHLPLFSPEELQASQRKPFHILMAAQIKPRKRPFDAVAIMHQLVQQGMDVQLTVCGDGVDRPQMEALIQEHNLGDRITLRGKVLRQEILNTMTQVDLVLLCSDNEGRPRILQEAIAAGRAIVAADNPGSREVLEDWSSHWALGRLYPIGDAIAASQAILELAPIVKSHPEKQIAPPLPSSQDVLYQYEALLQRLISQEAKVAS